MMNNRYDPCETVTAKRLGQLSDIFNLCRARVEVLNRLNREDTDSTAIDDRLREIGTMKAVDAEICKLFYYISSRLREGSK